jgi:hypothetical protein
MGSIPCRTVLGVSGITLCIVKVLSQYTSQAKYLRNKVLNKRNDGDDDNNRFLRD